MHLFTFISHQFLFSPLLLLVSSIAGFNSAVFGIIVVTKKVTRLFTILGETKIIFTKIQHNIFVIF